MAEANRVSQQFVRVFAGPFDTGNWRTYGYRSQNSLFTPGIK